MREKVLEIIKEIKAELIQLNEYIYNNPELGYEEFKSSKAHMALLKKHNFHVIEGYLGMETAFRAEYRGKGRPYHCLLGRIRCPARDRPWLWS